MRYPGSVEIAGGIEIAGVGIAGGMENGSVENGSEMFTSQGLFSPRCGKIKHAIKLI
jgi:hypothetical protein